MHQDHQRSRRNVPALRRAQHATRRKDPPSAAPSNTHVDVRAGVNQAAMTESGANVLAAQVFVISIAIGVALQSWWWGAAALFAFLIAITIPGVRTGVAIALALAAGYATYAILSFFEAGAGATWVPTILVTLIVMGWNLYGLEWFQDMDRKNST